MGNHCTNDYWIIGVHGMGMGFPTVLEIIVVIVMGLGLAFLLNLAINCIKGE